MPDPLVIRDAINKALQPPMSGGGQPIVEDVAKTEPFIPEAVPLTTIDDLRSRLGEPPYSQETLQQYQKEFQEEPRKILQPEAPNMFKDALSNSMTGRLIKPAWRLYTGTEDVFSASGRLFTMPGAGRRAGLPLDSELDERNRRKLSEFSDSYWDAIRTGWDIGAFIRGDKRHINEKLTRLQDNTPPAYWSEKFLAEQFHPINAVGFQIGSLQGVKGTRTLLGRVPYVGKVIEPFDVGYIQATNRIVDMVAKPIGWGFRKLPKTSTIKASESLIAVHNTVRQFFGNSYGDFGSARAPLTELMARSKQEVEQSGDPFAYPIRWFLDTSPPVVPTDLNGIKGGKVGLFQELAAHLDKPLRSGGRGAITSPRVLDKTWIATRANDLDTIYQFNDILQQLDHKAINKDQAVDMFLDNLAISDRSREVRGVVSKFITLKRGARDNFLESVKNLTPRKATQKIAERYSDYVRLRARYGVEDANYISGFISGILDNLDPVYQAVWRGFVERYVLRPSIEFILNFGTYPLGNKLEEGLNAMGAGVIPGHMGTGAFSRIAAGRKLEDYRLAENVGGVLSESATKPGDRVTGISRAWYEVRRGWIDAANKATTELRRHARASLYFQEAVATIPGDSPLIQVLREIPDVGEQDLLSKIALGEALKGKRSEERRVGK